MKKLLGRFKARKSNIMKLLLCVGGFLFAILIFVPCDAYLNNLWEFTFPITDFLLPLLVKFLISLIILTFLGLLLSEKIVNISSCLFCGLSLCVYAQCLFMNKHLGQFIGEEVEWDQFQDFGILTLIVWIVLLALPFILWLIIKKKRNFVLMLASGFLASVQLLSIIITMFVNINKITDYRNVDFNGAEQYTVSSQKNIITFIFDATDNVYFDKILSDSPETFDGLEDFTIYKNTCSIYDYTTVSITQMYTGYCETTPDNDVDPWLDKAWSTKKAEDFYDRFHNANYTINGYMDTGIELESMEGKFDNAEVESEPIIVDKQGIERNMFRLAEYKFLPFVLKKYVNTSEFDFWGFVKFANHFYYDNNLYFEHLNLTASNSDKNYFIVEHLNGTHTPCDDMIGETKNCLNIVKEYINQMKELGIYDNSTIIVTSDHGRHTTDYSEGAPTPIFMIKQANTTQDEMQFSNAPVSHADLMATYLKIAGLYTDEDKEVYGNSIFDFDENSRRERIYYCHTKDDNYPNYTGASKNVFYLYKYTGDSKDFQNLLENGSPSEVFVKK